MLFALGMIWDDHPNIVLSIINFVLLWAYDRAALVDFMMRFPISKSLYEVVVCAEVNCFRCFNGQFPVMEMLQS